MALFDPPKNQITALQKSIDDKNRAIGVYYNEIGLLYYKQYKDMNADVSKEINSRCENISNLYIEIEECRLRILYERGFKECAYCKKENLLEHAYCSACGQKFPESNDVSVVTRVDPVTLGPVGLKANDVPTVPVFAAPSAAAAAAATTTAEAIAQEVGQPEYQGVPTEVNTETLTNVDAPAPAGSEETPEEEPYMLAGDVCAEAPEDIASDETQQNEAGAEEVSVTAGTALTEEETIRVSEED